jgi:hypothetical protein
MWTKPKAKEKIRGLQYKGRKQREKIKPDRCSPLRSDRDFHAGGVERHIQTLQPLVQMGQQVIARQPVLDHFLSFEFALQGSLFLLNVSKGIFHFSLQKK